MSSHMNFRRFKKDPNVVSSYAYTLSWDILPLDDEGLTRSMTDEEITQVLHQLNPLKALGFHGMHAIFFKNSGMFLKTICGMIWAFLKHGYVLSWVKQNLSSLTIVLKEDQHREVNDFRPSSICNISYKIISTLLANRLRVILPTIISSLQNNFVSNTDIHNNILVAHQIISTFAIKRKNKGYMTIKLDRKKPMIGWTRIL